MRKITLALLMLLSTQCFSLPYINGLMGGGGSYAVNAGYIINTSSSIFNIDTGIGFKDVSNTGNQQYVYSGVGFNFNVINFKANVGLRKTGDGYYRIYVAPSIVVPFSQNIGLMMSIDQVGFFLVGFNFNF